MRIICKNLVIRARNQPLKDDLQVKRPRLLMIRIGKLIDLIDLSSTLLHSARLHSTYFNIVAFSMSFRQTFPLLSPKSKSKSSKQWISRQFRDPFVKQRLVDPAAYRSRSAFKLLEINDKMGGFLDHRDVQAVVDLGAAPGGWSQVVAGTFGWSAGMSAGAATGVWQGNKKIMMILITPANSIGAAGVVSPEFEESGALLFKGRSKQNSGRVGTPVEHHLGEYSDTDESDLLALPLSSVHRGRGTIVAVDLLPIVPIPGVHIVRGDFLLSSTTEHIRRSLALKDDADGKADIILSDIAANVSGNTAHDTQSSLDICDAVFQFTRSHLRSAKDIGRKKGGVLLYVCFSLSYSSRLLQMLQLNKMPLFFAA